MTDPRATNGEPESAQGSDSSGGSGVTIPGYQPVEALGGAPSFGIWVRAIQTRMDRHVLLKLLPPGVKGLSDYFAREISSLVRLDGNGVLRVIDEGMSGGVRYLVSDEASSVSLVGSDENQSDTAWIEFGRTVEGVFKAINDRDQVLLPIPARAFRSLPAGDFKTADLGWVVPVGEKLPEHKRIPEQLRGAPAERWMNARFLGDTLADVSAARSGAAPKEFRKLVADLQGVDLDPENPDPLANPVFEDAVVHHHSSGIFWLVGILVFIGLVVAGIVAKDRIFVDEPAPDPCATVIAESLPDYAGREWVLAGDLKEDLAIDEECFDQFVAALEEKGIEVRAVAPIPPYVEPPVHANEMAAVAALDDILGPIEEGEDEPDPWQLVNAKNVDALEAFVAREFPYADGRETPTPAQVGARNLALRWRRAEADIAWQAWANARRDIVAQIDRSPARAEARLDEYDPLAGVATADDRAVVRAAIEQRSFSMRRTIASDVEKLRFDDLYDDAKKRVRAHQDKLDKEDFKWAATLLDDIAREQARLKGILEAMRAAVKEAFSLTKVGKVGADGKRVDGADFKTAIERLETTLPPEEFLRQRERGKRWVSRFRKAAEVRDRLLRVLEKLGSSPRPYKAKGSEEVRGTVKSTFPDRVIIKLSGRRSELEIDFTDFEPTTLAEMFRDAQVLPPTDEEWALTTCLLGDLAEGLAMVPRSKPEWKQDLERVHAQQRAELLAERVAAGRKLAALTRWGEARDIVLYLTRNFPAKQLAEYRGEFYQWLMGYWGQNAKFAFPGAAVCEAQFIEDQWVVKELEYDFTGKSESEQKPSVDWKGIRGSVRVRTDCLEIQKVARLIPSGNRDVFIDRMTVEAVMQARLTSADRKANQGANLGLVLWSTARENSGALFSMGWRHYRVRSLERNQVQLLFPANIIADLSLLAKLNPEGLKAYRQDPKIEAKKSTGLTSKIRFSAESNGEQSVLQWKKPSGKLLGQEGEEPWVYANRKGTVEIHTQATTVRVYSIRITDAVLNPDWWQAWLVRKVESELPAR